MPRGDRSRPRCPEAGPPASSQGEATYPDHLRREVEAYLESLVFGTDEPSTAGLQEAMRYSLLAGGKRIRPVLALATARAVELEHSVLPLAAALELIHTYSLIHDDLPAMDDDDLRRGRPTCHRAFGEDVAILAGDGLYAEAFRHFTHHQRGEPQRVLSAVCELAAATGVDGMVGGQFIDVKGLAENGETTLRRLHELKTGRLIGASIECVLLLHASTSMEGIRDFARELGVLFQIVDDILDVTGTDAALGKPHGSDERHGKLTYVSSYGLDGARALAAESHQKARDALATAAPAKPAELEHITDFIFTRTS